MYRSPLVLVHSPLVGALAWQGVRAELARRGTAAAAPSLAAPMSARPGPYLPAITAAVSAAVPDGARSVVLVGHSGAGPLLPGIAQGLDVPVSALVYVDALLPEPGKAWFDRASASAVTRLRQLQEGDTLPPWDTWFSPEEIAEELPDPALRARFSQDLRPLPVAFFEEVTHAPVPAVPAGYLLFSDGYASSAGQAAGRGWPVVRLPGPHLAMLTDPEGVAAALLAVLDALGPAADGGHGPSVRSNTRCQ